MEFTRYSKNVSFLADYHAEESLLKVCIGGTPTRTFVQDEVLVAGLIVVAERKAPSRLVPDFNQVRPGRTLACRIGKRFEELTRHE